MLFRSPDEILKLDPLHGYICFPGNLPTAPVTLVPRSRPRIAAGFISRVDFEGDWSSANTGMPRSSGGSPHATGPVQAGPQSDTGGKGGDDGGEGGKAPQVRQESFDFADSKGSGQDLAAAVETSDRRRAEQQRRLGETATAPLARSSHDNASTPLARPEGALAAGPHSLQRAPGSGLDQSADAATNATGKPSTRKSRPIDPELFTPTGREQRELPDVGEFGLGE